MSHVTLLIALSGLDKVTACRETDEVVPRSTASCILHVGHGGPEMEILQILQTLEDTKGRVEVAPCVAVNSHEA
jgi:hypothetical protein